MHAELVAPRLLAMQPIPRLPALELLLARGRAAQDESLTPERWLARACGMAETSPPAGALTLLADGGDPGDGYWLRADPVHLEVGAEGATLTPAAQLRVERTEADALLEALNRHFGPEFDLRALAPQRWCLRTAREMPVEAHAPAEWAGAGGVMPQGAGRALALMTEIQMVLHDHAVNRAREQSGAPAINSVWLWGAGRLPREARIPWQSVCSDDPVALGLARLARVRHGALPQAAAQWLEHAPRDGRHLCVLEPPQSGQQLAELERRWFDPLLQALRQGRIGMITLRIPDAGDAWETTRADLRRFWRRRRPLAARA